MVGVGVGGSKQENLELHNYWMAPLIQSGIVVEQNINR